MNLTKIGEEPSVFVEVYEGFGLNHQGISS